MPFLKPLGDPIGAGATPNHCPDCGILSEPAVAVSLGSVPSAGAILPSEAQGVGFGGTTCLGSDDLLNCAILLHLMAQGARLALTDPPIIGPEACGDDVVDHVGKCLLPHCHDALEFSHGDDEPLAASLLVVVGITPLGWHVAVVCCQCAISLSPQHTMEHGLCSTAIGDGDHVVVVRVAWVAGAMTRQGSEGILLATRCQSNFDADPIMLACQIPTGDVV